MARSSGKKKEPAGLSATKQLEFHPLLVAARKTKLAPAVSDAAEQCDHALLRRQIIEFGDREVLRRAARVGIRDEHVVATPCLLKQKPSALGYYRLLTGLSKKQFYHRRTGFGPLESMEEGNVLTPRNEPHLPSVCKQLNSLIKDLVIPLDVNFTAEDIRDLPLLQLGAQLDGAHRVRIGETAAQEVFAVVGGLLRRHVSDASPKRLALTDAAGIPVIVRRSSDPDIEIIRDDGSARPRRIAIEIKGGTDLSNAHNRAGEAEKSHLKARKAGATQFWTVASLPPSNLTEFQAQSPTTNLWFDLSEVLGRKGNSWDEFRLQLTSAVGVPLS